MSNGNYDKNGKYIPFSRMDAGEPATLWDRFLSWAINPFITASVYLEDAHKDVPRWIGSKFLFWGVCWASYFGILLLLTVMRSFSPTINQEVITYTAETGNPFGHWIIAGIILAGSTVYLGITSQFKLFAGNVVLGLTIAGFFLYYEDGFAAMVWTSGCMMAVTSFFFNMYDVFTFDDFFGGHVTIFNIEAETKIDLLLCTIVGVIMMWLGECPLQ